MSIQVGDQAFVKDQYGVEREVSVLRVSPKMYPDDDTRFIVQFKDGEEAVHKQSQLLPVKTFGFHLRGYVFAKFPNVALKHGEIIGLGEDGFGKPCFLVQFPNTNPTWFGTDQLVIPHTTN